MKKPLRPIRAMLHCWFCGGRVVSIGSGRKVAGFRCVPEGVRWDATENLVIHSRSPEPVRLRDTETGQWLSTEGLLAPKRSTPPRRPVASRRATRRRKGVSVGA